MVESMFVFAFSTLGWVLSKVGHAYADYADEIWSTISTYKHLLKVAIIWVKNGSSFFCFQFWVPKISLLFIPLGFIHPQEWKIRVQNHNVLVKKKFIIFYHLMQFMRIWCASMHFGKIRRIAIPTMNLIMCSLCSVWGFIWKCTLEKSQTSTTSETMHALIQVFLKKGVYCVAALRGKDDK